MKLQIGQIIKKLRKEKELTQEELSEILGVSCQSVSRWELGVCYPDMELLPVIANYFDITIDKLMGVNEVIEQNKVNEYLTRFQESISRGDITSCIEIAREGVSEFPNNYILLNKLMYALFLSGDETGNIPNWQENMKKYDTEITAIGERIMKYCPHQDIRLEATARLAFNHCEMGRKEQGRAIYENLPPQRFCRENHMWWALKDEERLDFARKQIYDAYVSLSAGLYNMAYDRLLPDEDLIAVFQKMFELDTLIYDQIPATDYFYLAQNRCGFARVYARLNQTSECLMQLKLAAESAIAFDARSNSGITYSLLTGEREWKRCDFEIADSRTCCKIMRDSWLEDKDFDDIRGMDGFKNIVEML